MSLFCVGISHHTANVETRERYALQRSEEALRAESGCAEALILATCNRVEVYVSNPLPITTEQITRCLVRGRPEDSTMGPFYRHEGEECVRHLFRVVAGLDSMVIGETEILGQVKKAYAQARESGSAGPAVAPPFSAGVSRGKTSPQPDGYYARCGVGWFGRGGSGGQNFRRSP